MRQRKPNIIFIVMDSVRAANLSCYGYHRETTPNLDRLAARGTLFEQAISEGCWTLPVHASIFTGLYPIDHGVTVSKNALPKNCRTLAGMLRERGYQTACFSNNAYISDATGLTRGFAHVEDVWRLTHPRGTKRTPLSKIKLRLKKLGKFGTPFLAIIRLLKRISKIIKEQKNTGDSGADLTNTKIMEWLVESRNKEEPFFVFANYMECHERYSPPHPYERKFMPSRFSRWRILGVNPDKEKILESPPKKREEDIQILRALYDGELSYLDHKIGELLQFLESRGLMDETAIVITSDHGDSLGEHDELGHRTALYEQLIHVPLIIRYPKRFSIGRRVKEQVQLSDLYPTLLEVAGIRVVSDANNGFVSLCDLESLDEREFTISENTAPKSLDNIVSRSIRTQKYKFIWNSNGNHELYDLQQDGGEFHNIIECKPEVARRLKTLLFRWKDSNERLAFESGEAEFDQQLSERLKALGYMN